MILKVAVSGYLTHLPFGAIITLSLHESGCTLKVQMHPHWLELELLVGDGPGAENISQLKCGMWLVSLPDQGDHVVPLPILTGWLTRFWNFVMYSAYDFVVDDPLRFYFLKRGICCEYFQV